MKTIKKQKGFTLIELIIVVIILGILAVTAAPKFLDASSDAQEAAIDGVRGSLQAAVQIVRSRARLDSKGSDAYDGTDDETVTLDGTSITLDEGFIAPFASNVLAAMDITGFTAVADSATATAATQVRIWPTGLQGSAVDGTIGGTDPNNAPEDCYVQYDFDEPGGDTAPSISVTTTDC